MGHDVTAIVARGNEFANCQASAPAQPAGCRGQSFVDVASLFLNAEGRYHEHDS